MKSRAQSGLLVRMLVLVAIAMVGFALSELLHGEFGLHGKSSAGAGELRAKTPVATREQAKENARASVRKHGRRSSQEKRRAAELVIEAHCPSHSDSEVTLGEMFDRAKARKRLDRIRKGEFASPEDEKEFTPEEREILAVADEAVSDHDVETAIDVAAAALKSKDSRVRMKAVETMTEFGEAGLPELADFMQDSDPEVAQLAADRFELGAQEIEDEEEMVAVVKLGMLSISDPDELSAMAGTLLMANDALTVISALADVIQGGTPVQAAAAKEAYQSQTGEEWTGVSGAEKWLQENYSPDE